jgi:hypothetical protein
MMWEPLVQGRIGGDLAILELPSPDMKVASAQMGSKYYVGERGPVSRVSSFLYTYPWLFLALLVLAFLILAYAIYHLLKRQRRKRIGHDGV